MEGSAPTNLLAPSPPASPAGAARPPPADGRRCPERAAPRRGCGGAHYIPPAAYASRGDRTLFFARVAAAASDDEVARVFGTCGEVEELNLFRAWPGAKNSKGCGLVVFATPDGAARAIEVLHMRLTWDGADGVMVAERCNASRLGVKAANAAAARAHRALHHGGGRAGAAPPRRPAVMTPGAHSAPLAPTGPSSPQPPAAFPGAAAAAACGSGALAAALSARLPPLPGAACLGDRALSGPLHLPLACPSGGGGGGGGFGAAPPAPLLEFSSLDALLPLVRGGRLPGPCRCGLAAHGSSSKAPPHAPHLAPSSPALQAPGQMPQLHARGDSTSGAYAAGDFAANQWAPPPALLSPRQQQPQPVSVADAAAFCARREALLQSLASVERECAAIEATAARLHDQRTDIERLLKQELEAAQHAQHAQRTAQAAAAQAAAAPPRHQMCIPMTAAELDAVRCHAPTIALVSGAALSVDCGSPAAGGGCQPQLFLLVAGSPPQLQSAATLVTRVVHSLGAGSSAGAGFM